MFKLFFKCVDEFLAFWMNDVLIYSPTKEHITHLELVFEKFREPGIKLKMSQCEFLQNKIEYLGHLISGQGISPMKQKTKAIKNLAPATNITKARHMIGLIGYYRKFFPVFNDMIRPLNELTKKTCNPQIDGAMSEKLGLYKASQHYKLYPSLP